MTDLLQFTQLPTDWIRDKGLRAFKWAKGQGSTSLAALMVLMALASRAQKGRVKMSYREVASAAGISRAMVSAGLKLLIAQGIIVREEGQSNYLLTAFNPSGGWGKFPSKGLYGSSEDSSRIGPLKDFRLRSSVELDALKLFFLFVAFRNNSSNMAHISYEKITEYTGVASHRIKAALSLLAVSGLVYTERVPSDNSFSGTANAYRIASLLSHHHLGTTARGADTADFVTDSIFGEL